VPEPRTSFLYFTCQIGAEAALKQEVARTWPLWQFAYSRPGFVTFKLPVGLQLADQFDPSLVFARAHALSLGKVAAEPIETAAGEVWRLAGDLAPARLHVWERDIAAAGEHGYAPCITAGALAMREAILAVQPVERGVQAEAIANSGDLVLDVVLARDGAWWVGYHRAWGGATDWPGGIPTIAAPDQVASRAYLKMEEALRWSGLPVKPKDRVAEIGSSPGGASQALLERGLIVTGIDPAEMHPDVLAHPQFTHVRKRGQEVRRREFRKTRWLTADLNVAPSYTLDTVESIVTHPEVAIEGLLLTLKLLTWELAEQIPEFVARVRSWGYDDVRARQLAHNRQELCVAAMRRQPL